MRLIWYKKIIIITCALTAGASGCANLPVEEGPLMPSAKDIITKYQSSNWEIRQGAVKEMREGIRKSGNEVLELALLIASRDTHTVIRIEAIKGLETLKTKKSIERLNEIALTDENLNARWQALGALAKIGDPSSYQVFTQSFGSDDWLVREASIKGILAYSGSIPEETITPFVEQGLKDVNKSVTIATLQNLKDRYETLYPLIRSIFKKHLKTTHPLLAASLIAMKGYVLDVQTREEMIGLLGHKNREIRLLAYRVLKQEVVIKAGQNN